MKGVLPWVIIFICLCVRSRALSENFDDAIDEILADLSADILAEDMDSFVIPAINRPKLQCTSGNISGLHTFVRTGSFSAENVDDTHTVMNGSIGLNNITVIYPKCKILNFLTLPIGALSIHNSASFSVRLVRTAESTCHAELDSYSLDALKDLKVYLGETWIEKTTSFIIDILFTLIRDKLVPKMESVIDKIAVNLEKLNICGL